MHLVQFSPAGRIGTFIGGAHYSRPLKRNSRDAPTNSIAIRGCVPGIPRYVTPISDGSGITFRFIVLASFLCSLSGIYTPEEERIACSQDCPRALQPGLPVFDRGDPAVK